MEFLMATLIGVMFAAGTYMILRPSLIRVVMGFGLYSNAANLLLIACGGFSPDRESPFIAPGAAYPATCALPRTGSSRLQPLGSMDSDR